MKIALKVVFNDGTAQVCDAVFADFVAFERTWSRSVAKLEQDLRITDLAWLCWHSLTRTRKTALKFDPDWINTVETVGIREEEAQEKTVEQLMGRDNPNLEQTQPTG
jgi:hypothetical protein